MSKDVATFGLGNLELERIMFVALSVPGAVVYDPKAKNTDIRSSDPVR